MLKQPKSRLNFIVATFNCKTSSLSPEMSAFLLVQTHKQPQHIIHITGFGNKLLIPLKRVEVNISNNGYTKCGQSRFCFYLFLSLFSRSIFRA